MPAPTRAPAGPSDLVVQGQRGRPGGRQPHAVVAAEQHRRLRRRVLRRSPSRSRSGMPSGISVILGWPSARRMVASIEPGSAAVPASRNQRGPRRAISARCASVSTFCTRVGLPFRPRSVILGGMKVGIDGAAAQVVDQRGLLAGEEAGGRDGELDGDPVQSCVQPLLERLADPAGHVVLAVGVGDQDRGVRAERLGGELQAVEDQVRGEPEQRRVLVAGGLGLGAVRDHGRGPSAPVGRLEDGRELAVDREGGAAAAGQARFLDVADQRAGAGRGADAVAVGQVAVPGEVRGQVLRPFAVLRPGVAAGAGRWARPPGSHRRGRRPRSRRSSGGRPVSVVGARVLASGRRSPAGAVVDGGHDQADPLGPGHVAGGGRQPPDDRPATAIAQISARTKRTPCCRSPLEKNECTQATGQLR